MMNQSGRHPESLFSCSTQRAIWLRYLNQSDHHIYATPSKINIPLAGSFLWQKLTCLSSRGRTRFM